jgi:penicillin-binding protein 2
MTAVFGVLAGRLYQLQIVDGDSYLTQAEDNRISLRLLAPPRGRILDRFGVALAGSKRNYRVLVVPEQTRGGVAAAYDALAKVIPLNERVRGRVLKDAAARKSFMPVLIADNLSWDDFARLNLELPTSGVQPDVGETRDYPYAGELSHVLAMSRRFRRRKSQNVEIGDQLLDVPGFPRASAASKRSSIRRSADMPGRAGSRSAPMAGSSASSSANPVSGRGRVSHHRSELQSFMYQRLKDDSAGAAMMDVETAIFWRWFDAGI